MQHSPNPGAAYDVLADVQAIAPGDVWAIGDFAGSSGPQKTLIVHWNGSVWSALPPLVLGRRSAGLGAVTALSSTDLWVAGSRAPNNTLLAHWDGSAWTITPSPSPGAGYNDLFDLSFSSPTDGWAVGTADYRTLALHWDGMQWTQVPAPSPGSSGEDVLMGVVALSSTDAWAVGVADAASGNDSALIEHWDGETWEIVSSGSTTHGALGGVSAVSRDFIWAVGEYGDPITPSTPRIERWDGAGWETVDIAPVNAALSSVSAPTASSAWAVGTRFATEGGELASRTLAARWDGKAWMGVLTPNPTEYENSLSSVSALSPSLAWAVGYQRVFRGNSRTLIMVRC